MSTSHTSSPRTSAAGAIARRIARADATIDDLLARRHEDRATIRAQRIQIENLKQQILRASRKGQP